MGCSRCGSKPPRNNTAFVAPINTVDVNANITRSLNNNFSNFSNVNMIPVNKNITATAVNRNNRTVDTNVEVDGPQVWGPILWTYLHKLMERILELNGPNIGHYIEFMLNNLPNIIPCLKCQEHAKQYIKYNPVPTLKNLPASEINKIAKVWVFDFHNAVRKRTGKKILLHNISYFNNYYKLHLKGKPISSNDYYKLIKIIEDAVKENVVNVNIWKEWNAAADYFKTNIANFVQ